MKAMDQQYLSTPFYGSRRMKVWLGRQGHTVNRKRVQRLMRTMGLRAIYRRPRTSKPGPGHKVYPYLLRDLKIDHANQVWCTDITYIPTWAGFLYLAVVIDAWSRRVVGWAMASHLRTELVLDALNMALAQRHPEDVIHHSDQGCQYTAIAFGQRCKQARVRPSMGSVGDCYDNAMCESFFATLECELLEQQRFTSQAEARMAVFDFIEGWYNPHRRHQSLGQQSPINFERSHQPGLVDQSL